MKASSIKISSTVIIIFLIFFSQDVQSQFAKSDSSWFTQESNTTQSLRDVFFVNDTIGWSVGDYGTILKTINGGKTWNAQNAGSNLYKLYDVFFIDENTGWISLINASILKTINGGITWELVNTGFSPLIYDICFSDANNGWITGTDSNTGEPDEAMILKTTDGGNNWMKQLSDTSDILNLRCLSFLDSLTGWAGGELEDPWGSTGVVYKTIDGGNNWELLTDSLESYAEGIQFVNDYVGWIAGSAIGYIAKSTDGGYTWDTQRIGVDEWYSSLCFTNNYTGWVVGNGSDPNTGVILKTVNGGETWYYQFVGETLPIAAVNFSNDYFGWAVGTQGMIIHTESGGEDITVEKYGRNKLNKTINNFQTTEDKLYIGYNKNHLQTQTLIEVELLIDNLQHTSDGDLEITLSHNGISETMIYQAGGNGDNFIGTKLTDNAIDNIIDGSAPFKGNFKPENPLSTFAETNPDGEWTISIYDDVESNTGTLQSWGINLIYSSSSGLGDDVMSTADINVFPNPASDKVSLQSTVFRQQSTTVELYDLNGRKLLEKYILKGSKTVQIDVSGLQSGVYFCRVTVDNKSVTNKLIIQE